MMRQTMFHDGWTCRHLNEPGEGTPVRIPDDAMLREQRTVDALGGLNVSWFEGHDYLYAKTFSLAEEELRLRHVLEFEGVYRCAEVRINGKKAGFRPYGYTNFYVDCDDFLTAGENTLEVIARNADQPNSRWYSGAGIYRPVRMWTGEKDRYIELNGVKVKTLSLSPAQIGVTVKTHGEGPVGRKAWPPPSEHRGPSPFRSPAHSPGARSTRSCTPAACASETTRPRNPSACARCPGGRTASCSTGSG